MAAIAVVGGRDDLRAAFAPDLDDAIDRRRRQVGPVREDDDRRRDVSAEGPEPAAQRRPAAALPLGAGHRRRVDVELVRARDDDRVGHRASPHAVDDGLCEDALLRSAEARRRSSRQDDDR